DKARFLCRPENTLAMGAGASCPKEGTGTSASLHRRSQTILILRAYNCRPRDLTLREQFDAVADKEGRVTKEKIRAALKLSDTPHIQAMLENAIAGKESISVDEFLAYLEQGTSLPQTCPQVRSAPAWNSAFYGTKMGSPPCKGIITMDQGIVEGMNHRSPYSSSQKSDPVECKTQTNGSCTQLPLGLGQGGEKAGAVPVVPIHPKWGPTNTAVPGVADRKKGTDRGRGRGQVQGPQQCSSIVKYVGGVLALRGAEAYRRASPSQPVWRKKETLTQERVVQYTTLDETGQMQELCETEKSQTIVLHMECKDTGEFAHREMTQYESRETFNGEVVVEESGSEEYVHLRSKDDEYEHLESNLPPRARGAAPGGAESGGGPGPGAGGTPRGSGAPGGESGAEDGYRDGGGAHHQGIYVENARQRGGEGVAGMSGNVAGGGGVAT
ncbi:unnamed protein product, partial [Discosporangium mesarthrocarpum]